MNAFEKCQSVEERGMADVIPFLKRTFPKGFCLTNKGRLSKEVQKKYGDAFGNDIDGNLCAVECKCEEMNKYRNFFLEWWSNESRLTPGWMQTLDADVLVYYFIEEKDLYLIDFPHLKDMCRCPIGDFGIPWIERYPKKTQGKYSQLNDTSGYCVPITDFKKFIGFDRYSLKSGIKLIEAKRQMFCEKQEEMF